MTPSVRRGTTPGSPAHWYSTVRHARRRLPRTETGDRDHASYVLESGSTRASCSSVLARRRDPGGRARRGPRRRWHHGLALEVPRTCIAAWGGGWPRRALVFEGAARVADEHGTVVLAAIATYGDTRHTSSTAGHRRGYLPGFVDHAAPQRPERRFFQAVDHCVGNVEKGAWTVVGRVLPRVMGSNRAEFGDDIATECSAS